MHNQSLFSGKDRKNISKCGLTKILSSMLSVNNYLTDCSRNIISTLNIHTQCLSNLCRLPEHFDQGLHCLIYRDYTVYLSASTF